MKDKESGNLFEDTNDSVYEIQGGMLDAEQILNNYRSKINRSRQIRNPMAVRVIAKFPDTARNISHITLSSKDPAVPPLRFDVISQDSEHTRYRQPEDTVIPQAGTASYLTLSSDDATTIRARLSLLPTKEKLPDFSSSRLLKESEREIVDIAKRIASLEQQIEKGSRQKKPDIFENQTTASFVDTPQSISPSSKHTNLDPIQSIWQDRYEVTSFEMPESALSSTLQGYRNVSHTSRDDKEKQVASQFHSPAPPPIEMKPQLSKPLKIAAESIKHLSIATGESNQHVIRGTLSTEDSARIMRGEITPPDIPKVIDQVTVSFTLAKVGEIIEQTIADATDTSPTDFIILGEKWIQRK